jgi:hypothetical protein
MSTMSPAECGQLLALMALYDNRKVGPLDIAAWLKVVGDLLYADAEAAVVAHYTESRERIMPADIRERVNDVRRERLKNAPVLDPPHEVADDPAAYQRWLEREQRRIADGIAPLKAVEQ